ncbi:hypothetical protein JOC77_002608 [Peribacillus deserti]|uniref:Uncharacterized protein n=2 Tax=Peribacillus deserti TaxID=673318 RepID=A0ABS2QJ30_9BACI|nr:hypothetical protein [Peribacillus deserti]MBM7693168.1 hypothetical protein [Peribacillus deserti]
MLIKSCKGYELEKELPNTSEDFFNKSEVVYQEDGKEKSLQILYLRFFEERMNNISPFARDPIFTAGGREIFFRDLVGFVSLIKNPEYRQRKRVYLNNEKDFASLFKDVDFDKFPAVFEEINNYGYELHSPKEFIAQNFTK